MTATCSNAFAVAVAIGCLFLPDVGTADTSDSSSKLMLNAKDFGAKGDGNSDDDAALNRALAAAAQHGPGTELLIPAGTYCLGAARPVVARSKRSAHLTITQANGVVVEGEKGTVLLSRDLTKDFIFIDQSKGVTIRGLTLDTHPLPFTQGVVTAVDPSNRTVDLQVESGYDDIDRPDLLAVPEIRFCDSPYTDGWKENQYFPRLENRVRLGPDRWRVTVWEKYKYDQALVGKKWLLWNKNSRAFAVRIEHSDQCTVQDVRMYEVIAGGFDLHYNGSITVRNVYIGPPPGSTRLFAGEGGAMSFFNRGVMTLEDCDFSHIDDDGFNLGTHFVHVVGKLGPQSCRTEPWPADFLVGDTVAIWDWKKKVERGTAKVTGAKKEEDGHWTLQFDQPLEFGTVGEADPDTKRGDQESDGIDRLIDLDSAGSCVLRGNKISSLRARGFLVKTGHSLIEDNLFYDTHMPGILAGPEFYWGEGPELRGLIIRHNTFRNIDAPNIEVATFDSPTAIANHDVTIEDNTFEDYGRFPVIYKRHDPIGVAIWVRNTDGVTIRNNHIAPPAPDCPKVNPIDVEVCRNVHVSP